MNRSDQFAVLKQYFGYDSFREGQEPLINALLSGRDALGIMPTGAGKSICYQIPSLLLPGVTLVISPLISLMKDQVMALVQAGVKAAYMNSSLRADQYATVLKRAIDGWYKIIYVAPERLDTHDFLRFVRATDISALIVDEAHCISQWGQDFRPSYLKIVDFIAALPKRPVVGAFTATATPRVKRDIAEKLRLRNPLLVTTSFDRPNLFFAVWKGNRKNQALTAFLRDKRDKSGIIYCATRKTVEEVCDALCRAGYAATRYHAGLSDEERRTNQDDFQYDRKTVMVATNAFGMGIDKSNVSYVVHYNMPKNLESYYQEAGRAGRDGEKADCLLLYSKQDVVTAQWLIQHSGENPELSAQERRTIEEREMDKLKWMTYYATADDCLRNRLLKYFGEYHDADCGNCGNCRPAAIAIPEKTVTAPGRSLRGNSALQHKRNAKVEEHLAVLAALKALRMQIAHENGVPAFVVFSDATLSEMAHQCPQTRNDLSSISGVGDVKIARYGQRFLDCISKAVAENEAQKAGLQEEDSHPDIHHLVSPKKRAPKVQKLSKKDFLRRTAATKCETGKAWTAEDERQLRAYIHVGLSMGQLSEVLNRSIDDIAKKLRELR